MIPSKIFIYYLLNTATGNAYYIDSAGNIQSINILAASFPVDLKNAPAGWLQTTLAFDRNMTYYGLNRSYTTPQEFVRDAKKMIEQLVILGLGTEALLSLAVFKYNSQPQAGEPEYNLYFKAPLDIADATGVILETITCNLMEGGVMKLLKTYENTILEIPCDGSDPRHIKCNYNGTYVPDTLFYTIPPTDFDFENGGLGHNIPCNFVNNINENFGILHSDTQYSDWVFPYEDIQTVIYSTSGTRINIKGEIVIQPYTSTVSVGILVMTQLSNPATPTVVATTQIMKGETRIPFNFSVDLAANERFYSLRLVPWIGAASGTVPVGRIVSGSFQIDIATKPNDSRAWGWKAYDLWQAIGEKICSLSSSTAQTFNYLFTSDLLQQHLNFFITCGDALRASNDPNYQRFYSINNNNETNFGVVLKTTLKHFYESLRVPLCAAIAKGDDETLDFTTMDSVFPDAVNYELGETSKLEYKVQSDNFRFSDLYIGYETKDNDQVSGKYEWNTTAKFKAPIIGFQKDLNLVSTYTFSSFIIERLRANIQNGANTSSTRNYNDNTVAGTIIDLNQSIYDYFRGQFISLISDPDNSDNTNIHFETDQQYQKYDHPITDGSYFNVKKDFGIFIFSETGYGATETTTINITGIVNSVNRPATAPQDSIIIRYWLNGVVIKTYTILVTGIDTPISISDSFSQAYTDSDCIYITSETSAFAVANIATANLTIGSYVSMAGSNIPILSGIGLQILSLPNVIPSSNPYDSSSVVQYGFQYFQYNSLSYYNNFDIQLGVLGYKEGDAINNSFFDIYINGVRTAGYIILTPSGPRVQFAIASALINRNFSLNDIVFVVFTSKFNLEVQLITSTLTFTSTSVLCYPPYRVEYDNLTGIPNLAKDGNDFSTALPGSPYNIEYVSPARCLQAWMKFINSHFFTQVTGQLKFQSLDKNPYLSTTLGAVTITENASYNLLQTDRYFYPIEVSFEFKCPLTFAQMQDQYKNAHVKILFGGEPLYVHILHIEQNGALNDTTKAVGLLSALTDLSIFVKLTGFKIDI